MDIILKYFPGLTEEQRRQFEILYSLYGEWNAKINVVSRKDFESLYLKHILHSLAVAKACSFDDGARVIDIGTGGGFPAIPLAIMFPEVHFTAADSIGKKIRVVEEVAKGAGIKNITPLNARAEQVPGRFDYAVSRAVTDAATVMQWVWSKLERGRKGSLPNGLLLLKGGDLAEELAATGRKCSWWNISDWFSEEFFDTKKVIYIEKT